MGSNIGWALAKSTCFVNQLKLMRQNALFAIYSVTQGLLFIIVCKSKEKATNIRQPFYENGVLNILVTL
ncbi:MAG: hypothetical protein ACJAUJ_001371 [Salibacteraceae bacterium]|jgi:hypothetical protein